MSEKEDFEERSKLLAEFTSLLDDTYVFEEKVAGWDSDRKFEDDGGRIIYAVDSDIFQFFVEPFSEGPDRKNALTGRRSRAGYSQIFRSDSREVAGVIGDAISQAIFFDNGQPPNFSKTPRSLLLLSGVEREVFDFINYKLSEVSAAGKKVNGGRLKSEIKAFIDVVRDTNDQSEKYTLVREKMPLLFEVFFQPNSLRRQAEKLLQLAQDSSAVYFGNLNTGDLNHYPYDLIKASVDLSSSKATARKQEIFEEVKTNFPNIGSKKIDAKNADLQALSELLVLNELLVPKGIKLCLITGAWSMFDALSKIVVNSKTGKLIGSAKENPDSSPVSASTYCLRYPIAFWGSRSFKENIKATSHPEETNGFIDNWIKWPDPIIPARLTKKSGIHHTSDLRSYAQRAIGLGIDSEYLEEFKRNWNAFTSLLIPSRAEVMQEFDDDLEEVFSDLGQAFNTTFNLLFDSCAFLGVAVSSLAPHGLPPRLTPPIIFDCSDKAQTAINAIEAAVQRENPDLDETTFKTAMLDLRNSDQSSYFFNVGVSMIFASQGQYDSAKMYINRAIQVAQSLDSSKATETRVSGREAYFLKSILIRQKARKLSDFDLAKTTLRLARHRLLIDTELDRGLEISDIRFECERIAQNLGKKLFEKFVLGKDSLPVSELDEFLSSINNLRDRKYMSLEDKFKRRLAKQLSFNALSAGLHSNAFRKNIEKHPNTKAQLQKHLTNVLGINGSWVDDNNVNSYLHKVVVCAASCLLIEPPRNDNERETIENIFDPIKTDLYKVTVYDPQRFEELHSICRS